MVASQYELRADSFLNQHGITFSVERLGVNCPPFCKDAQKPSATTTFPRRDHIHGAHHRVTLKRADKYFSFDFWNCYADEERNYYITKGLFAWDYHSLPLNHPARKYKGLRPKDKAKVTAYDALCCLEKNEPGTFNDFCGNFGYDNDSIQALKVYELVFQQWEQVRRFFTTEELTELQEIN